MMKYWMSCLFIFCYTILIGQVTVTTELGPPPYTGGQPISLNIKVVHPSTVAMGNIDSEGFREDFSIQNGNTEFKSSKSGNNIVLTKRLQIIPKISGEVLIPPVLASFVLNNEEAGAVSKIKKITVAASAKGEPVKEYPMPLTEESLAYMNKMLSSMPNPGALGGNDAPTQPGIQAPPGGAPQQQIANPYGEIKDLKPIIEEPLKFQDFAPYLIGILLLVGLIFAIYYFVNKSKQPEPAPEPEVWVPAHNTALTDLQDLKNKQLWQNGEVKEYQTELTNIIRKYLENRFDINALEMTSDDIVYHLKKKTTVSDSQQGKVKDILQIADLVKFAKANPPVNINEQFWNDAENFVQETKTDEVPAAFIAKQEAVQAEYEARIANSKPSKKRNKST